MVYGGLPIFIVLSLVFSSSFAVEPVETAPFVPKNTPLIEPNSPTEAIPLTEPTQRLGLTQLSVSSQLSESAQLSEPAPRLELNPAEAVSAPLLEQLEIELSEQHNPTKQFQDLQAAINFYQSIEASGQWNSIEDGPLLRVGDADPQVVELRGLLRLYGDLEQEAAALEPLDLFDLQLHQALQDFQQRHGTKPDGVLGPKTRRLLNVSPQQRIDQLSLNIYRQQQLEWNIADIESAELETIDSNNSLGLKDVALEKKGRYLQVNIPEYRLRLYDQGEVLLEMKTIIGRRSRQTPSFSTEIKSLVVNPSWNVPRSIAFRDVLPKWQKDKTYLSRHNLQVVAGWEMPRVIVPEEQIDLENMYRGAAYHRLWEPPSDKNTLGRLKFQLNAGNSIYLHDTKSPYLFQSEVRAFSSGCIRLEKPRILADMLLQQSNQWEPQQLASLFENTDTHRIRLKNPIPVHITYWTAWLDDKGVLNFADDLYHRDPVDWAYFKNQQQKHQEVALKLIN